MAIATAKEACIGETMSCIEMARKNEKMFATIIEDEIRHAALGWRTVRWAIKQDERLIKQVKCEEVQPLIEWLFSKHQEDELENLIKQVIKS